jgi:hypothetical protein
MKKINRFIFEDYPLIGYIAVIAITFVVASLVGIFRIGLDSINKDNTNYEICPEELAAEECDLYDSVISGKFFDYDLKYQMFWIYNIKTALVPDSEFSALDLEQVQKETYVYDYDIDLDMLVDFEAIRGLFDVCSDLGDLENHRDSIETTGDLENLRNLFEHYGNVKFYGCPAPNSNFRHLIGDQITIIN